MQAKEFQRPVCCASPNSANLPVSRNDADTVCVRDGEEESHAGGHGEGAVRILTARAGAGQPFRGRLSEGQRSEESTADHPVSSVSPLLPLQPGSSLSPRFF